MKNYIEDLYELLNIKPKEETICNSPTNKCLNITKECKHCGYGLKSKKFLINEIQQYGLIKVLLNTLLWIRIGDLSFTNDYSNGLAKIFVNSWDKISKENKKRIKEIIENDR